jgi:hypothetical protein
MRIDPRKAVMIRRLEVMVLEIHAAQAVVPQVGGLRTMLLEWLNTTQSAINMLNEKHAKGE